jgi:hypothetical protein
VAIDDKMNREKGGLITEKLLERKDLLFEVLILQIQEIVASKPNHKAYH